MTNKDKQYWVDKKILVTGGSGFLGSHVVKKIIKLWSSGKKYINTSL